MAVDTNLFNTVELLVFAVFALVFPMLVMGASKLLMWQPWRADWDGWVKWYPWSSYFLAVGWFVKPCLIGVAATLIALKNLRFETQLNQLEEVDDSAFQDQEFDFYTAGMALHLALMFVIAFWPSVMFRSKMHKCALFMLFLELALGGVVCGLWFGLSWVAGMLYAMFLGWTLFFETIPILGIVVIHESIHHEERVPMARGTGKHRGGSRR